MRRVISLFTAFLLCALCLAGCGGRTDEPGAVSTPGAASEPGGSQEPKAVLPYEGEPIVWKGLSPDFGVKDSDTICSQAWYEHVGNLSVEWEYLPASDFSEKFKVLMASMELPDLIPVENPLNVMSTYADSLESAFLDFGAYADYMPALREYQETYPVLEQALTKEGNRYFLFALTLSDGAGESWFANMDVLQKAGAAVPQTKDEFLAALRAVKQSQPDVIPFQSIWNISYTQNWMARLIGARTDLTYWDSAAQEFKSAYREPDAKRRELIELMASLYAEELINPEIANMSFEQELNVLSTGKWAFTTTYVDTLEKEAFKVEPGDPLPVSIEPILPPAAEDGARYIPLAYQTDIVPWWVIAAGKNVKHPELLAAYVDASVSPYSVDLLSYGVEGKTYTLENGKPVLLEGVNKAEAGIGYVTNLQYMIGVMPEVPSGEYLLMQEGYTLLQGSLKSGALTGLWKTAETRFTTEESDEVSYLENALNTYVTENEAKFIYGQRPMSEWDDYVAELNDIVDIDELLRYYNSAERVLHESDRIYLTQ